MDDTIQNEIDSVLEQFKEWALSNVSGGDPHSNTIQAYIGDTREYLIWLVDRKLIGLGEDHQLTIGKTRASEYHRYLNYLTTKYMSSTVDRKRASLKRFYDMALAVGLASSDPTARRYKIPNQNTQDHARQVGEQHLAPEQISQLIKAPNVTTPEGKRDVAILALMTMHGLEVGEIHNLNVDDIDLSRGKAGILHVMGRGGKEREIPLSTKSSDLLKAWLTERTLWLTQKGLVQLDGNPVFVAMHWATDSRYKLGQRISCRGLRNVVDRHLRTISVKKEGVSCHALRADFFALTLESSNVSLQEIKDAMEHSSIGTTRVHAS